MAYATVFAGLMLLWPMLAALGTLGFAPLIGITGIAALILARPLWPLRPYVIFGLLFILWAAISEIWSPTASTLMTGSLIKGNFAIGTRSVIIVLTSLFAMLTLAGAVRTQLTRRGAVFLYAAFGLQALTILIAAGFYEPLLEAIYGDDPQNAVNGIQNIGRNINIFALVLPLLAGLLICRAGRAGLAGAAVLILGYVAAALVTDNQAAILAVAGFLGAWALVHFLPRTGLRWLVGGVGGYIVAAPFLISGLVRASPLFASYLPGSFRSRLWSWEVVIAKIGERPLTGHGLMATRSWRETFSQYPDWLAQLPDFWARYPVVPGHPHNMPLQIWAETGAIGALLAAAALIALAFRLPAPGEMRPEFRLAAAGLVGAGVMIFSFSYSVWAEGFWAGTALIIASLILLARQERRAE
ncbi:MAG: O-antigen ligase family protein [Hyphomonas sp.]